MTATAVPPTKAARHALITRLLAHQAIRSQAELAARMTAAGFAAYGLYCGVDAWARHP